MARKSVAKKTSSTNSNRKTNSKPNPGILVAGDNSIDSFIYLEGFPDKPADLREAWVDAVRFWSVKLDGGAGSLRQYLKATGINAEDPCPLSGDIAESIYFLTRKNNKKGQDWSVEQAITAGEHEYPSGELNKCDFKKISKSIPAVILDFNQGWLAKNRETVPEFLQKRKYIVRTHDPLKEEWKSVRKTGTGRGIWFSPVQDMANGSLWFPGNWESLRERLTDYLQTDDTIWKKGKWLHYVVIQIAYDGALIVGPGIPGQGKLLIYKGDQPDSFSREGYGTVVAGGIVFVYSLTQALLSSTSLNTKHVLECSTTGLARLRAVVKKGYDGPMEGQVNWEQTTTTNLPVASLENVDTKNIITYSKPPAANWKTACEIICCSDDELRERTVFRLGNLLTSSPEYADTLLRLASRVETHVNNGKGVLSFSIFGGPGSGKTFVAEQIAEAIDDPSKNRFEYLTFNLSQFNDSLRLVDAFKQIQTASLQGKTPLVLWDEFDTSYNGSEAGWISSFLMPMQDAEFFDGMTNRALGKCIFVFIGGTFKDDAEFNAWASTGKGKTMKGPDFHSRLNNSLTVPSVDLALNIDKSTQGDDPAKLVRAVLIRAFLKKQQKVKVISQDVLAFLLHVPLQHGVRSLEKIISTSALGKTRHFQAFHLPPLDVLQLHVDESKINSKKINSYLRDMKLTYYQEPSLELKWRR
ncbi:MAG: AAA family ATPase [Nitrospirota bacterium]|nr:AAA family ATPase [Nitrospirota bacterium]